MSNVIIVGAPRSGTNMLRDMLIKLDGVETWPCDEINYIWRHGNISYPSDCFTPEMATPEVKSYIKRQFDSFRVKSNADVIIEKTCATTLRVGFVNEVFPEAKYIHIIRDGADAVGSAKLRWTANLDIPYLMKKVRYVPISDLPYYAIRYAWNRLVKLFSKNRTLSYWGPQLDNMKELTSGFSVFEICALQWKVCVSRSRKELEQYDPRRVYTLKYEDFVANPTEEFVKLSKFIGKIPSAETVKKVVGSTSSKSVGKGRSQLDTKEAKKVNDIISEELKLYGYLPLDKDNDI
ncbi:sulfotransferase family protein [Vibrio sp. C8]